MHWVLPFFRKIEKIYWFDCNASPFPLGARDKIFISQSLQSFLFLLGGGGHENEEGPGEIQSLDYLVLCFANGQSKFIIYDNVRPQM